MKLQLKNNCAFSREDKAAISVLSSEDVPDEEKMRKVFHLQIVL